MATNAFQPAAGGAARGEANLSGMSKQYAARDMPANKTLKYREKGQHTQEELRLKDRDGLRRELEERERNIRDKQQPQRSSSDTKRITSGGTTSSRSKPSITHTETNIDADDPLDESSSDEETTSSRHPSKFSKNTQQNRSMNNEEEEDDNDDDDDDDDEDDTAELMAELARIKKERATETARLEQLKRVEEEKIRTENILKGNPLLNPSTKVAAQPSTTEFRVKRRWDDDVVFKNCAKADGSSGEKRVAQFVNDSLRSEFHRRFMDKYIK
ncbi:unnamed protein product [Adineta steineri]|uniref:Uncharacterized protein n=1 Tax=Adineta steineri TaxID=433720 RepID=A0A815QBC2_9BILA|nr:unnamed protein product [Adineta steineri]CAF3604847.1 unnamed protein product [Adineta steineri]